MGETCEVCGRTERECARFAGELSTMGCTEEESIDCWSTGYERIRQVLKEWDPQRIADSLAALLPWAEGTHYGDKDCDCDRCEKVNAARAALGAAGYDWQAARL